jgi:diguanylate cyclase (GGDEF)-like protein
MPTTGPYTWSARRRISPLSGAINHTTLFAKIHASLTKQAPGDMAALLCLDIDYFKESNDKYGHPVGDRGGPGCLNSSPRRISGFLPGYVRCGDRVLGARLGGRSPTGVAPKTRLRKYHAAIALGDQLK